MNQYSNYYIFMRSSINYDPYNTICMLQKVDYKGIGASVEFNRYVRLTKELQRVDILATTREEKLAFFINIYNALVIHANIVRGPPDNLWQRYKVSQQAEVVQWGLVASSLVSADVISIYIYMYVCVCVCE